jgi:hypothetical protein
LDIRRPALGQRDRFYLPLTKQGLEKPPVVGNLAQAQGLSHTVLCKPEAGGLNAPSSRGNALLLLRVGTQRTLRTSEPTEANTDQTQRL